jgi:molybdate transport system ATP-binding protein
MSSLQISQGTFRLGDTRTLSIDHLTLQSGESWAFVGANGSGKSALAKALAGELTLLKGDRQSNFSRITRLSFEQLQKLVSEEWQRNNTDMLSPGEDDTGRTTAEIIQDEVKDAARCQQLAERFGITSLLSRRFKYLSTGETRKTLLCQALMSQPDLLILDEPFDGLDVHSRQNLALLLAELNAEGYTLVLVLNRFDEIPDFVQNAGVLADCALTEIGEKSALLQQALIAQLAHSENLAGMALPEPDAPPARDQLTAGEPLIVLKEGVVSYNDRPIINHLNWTVRPGNTGKLAGRTARENRRCSAW